MRNPFELVRKFGFHSLIFQLIIGMRISFLLINSILWLVTISYFALYAYVGPTIEALYPAPVFYMAITCLVFGNFIYFYTYMIGAAKRGNWPVIKYVFFIPFYWLMGSIAAGIAFYQLITKPHYWEKSAHGHSLDKNKKAEDVPVTAARGWLGGVRIQENLNLFKNSELGGASLLVVAGILGDFFSFVYNAYLGRVLDIDDFGLISLFGSFLFIAKVPMNSLGRSVTHKTAYFLGEFGTPLKAFWRYVRSRTIYISIAAAIVWLALTPFLERFFHTNNPLPFVLFAPVWIIGAVSAVDSGFLSGNLKFLSLAVVSIIFPLAKFIFTVAFVKYGYSELVYAATPLAMVISFLAGWYFITRIRAKRLVAKKLSFKDFPTKFFGSSVLIKLSEMTYFTVDIVLAKHFLSPREAGEYALLTLVGKMIFFIGDLANQFILPLTSREKGAGRSGKQVFYKIFSVTVATTAIGYFAVGVLGKFTTPFLFGSKVNSVVYLLPVYGLAMFGFGIADAVISYEQARNKHMISVLSLALGGVQVAGMFMFHRNLTQFVWVMTFIGLANMGVTLLFHFLNDPLEKFFKDLGNKFFSQQISGNYKQSILIYNWRDVKHVWAGGAEVYIHELAKRWVAAGNKVTIFCGNDGKSLKNEIIDGVNIVRRGGFYTVYIWAVLYYIFKFRKDADIVIDSENGIPFFTPLYIRKPIIGLVHHVHSEIILKELKLPKYLLPAGFVASLLESKIMPLVYRNCQMVTVSKSSKMDMERYGMGKNKPILVVPPGVDLSLYKPTRKYKNPTLLYLGRLKAYKSVDTLIKATARLLPTMPDLKTYIAGFGDHKQNLEKLVSKLGISGSVKFVGKVDNDEKVRLMGSSWVFVYPSMWEGWGMSVVEANACGTPVVASNAPGLRDSVSNPYSGYLVPRGDVEQFAEKIELLLTDNKMRRKFDRNSVRWAKRFNWSFSAERFVNIMNNLNQ